MNRTVGGELTDLYEEAQPMIFDFYPMLKPEKMEKEE
jgi:hypothetical protein